MAKVSKNAFWNESKVKALLTVSDQAVKDALLAVYNNQTAHEQVAESTTVDNGIGFSGTNALLGSSLAKQILAGRELSVVSRNGGNGQMFYARKIALHHWGQFAQALNEERAEKGLPTEGPKPEKGTAQPAERSSRFAWEPGDLQKVGEVAVPEKQYELFQEEEEAQKTQHVGSLVLGNFQAVQDLCLRNHPEDPQGAFDEFLQTPEWNAHIDAVNREANAWVRLVEASSGDFSTEWGSVPTLSQQWRNAEAHRVAVMSALGEKDLTHERESFAGRWHRHYGSGYKAYDFWLKSGNRDAALAKVREEDAAKKAALQGVMA